MATYTFPKFPTPVVLLGNHFNSQESRTIIDHLSELQQFVRTDSNLEDEEDSVSPKCISLLKLLGLLIEESNQLYKKVVQSQRKLFNVTIERNLKSLNVSVENIKTVLGSELHKGAEITRALGKLEELLTEFDKSASVFREHFNEGASLFCYFCGILKAISSIARETKGFETGNLVQLSRKYQSTLNWYRKKVIGTRLASCYVGGIAMEWNGLFPAVAPWTYDWDRLCDKYGDEYFDDPSKRSWQSCSLDLGGKGWKVWYSSVYYLQLVDTWDTRSHEDVLFEALEINLNDSNNSTKQLYRNALEEYRQRVEKAMTEFFDSFNLFSLL